MTGKKNCMKFCRIAWMMASYNACGPLKLGSVTGFQEKRNEVIYHFPHSLPSLGCIVFFGGDIQDYKDNMLGHLDNRCYSDWDLETTTVLLHKRFPDQDIIVVKPSKMTFKTFSCFENFLEINNFGAPIYSNNLDALLHLKPLLCNVLMTVKQKYSELIPEETLPSVTAEKPVTVIGFSKGCVVLNQILHSFHTLDEAPDSNLDSFAHQISDMYWLDGGHSGSSSTWITDKSILQSFSKLPIKVHIHVTPYQVQSDTRPRIGKEEKNFRENLKRMGMDVVRKLHFEREPRSLEKHFEILEAFESSKLD